MPYRLPPLNALRLFEAAGRHLSFKLAAEELHLTPSAVSHGIKSLEDWLGTALFLRGRPGLALTEAGQAYLPRVRDALDLLARADEDLPGRAPRRRLALSVAPSFAVRWLIPRLPRFREEHPAIEVSLDSSQHRVDFARDGMDLAIRMGRGDWPELYAASLAVEQLVPVCAPSLAARIGSLGDLAGQTLLQVTSVSEDWAAWARLAGAGDLDLAQGVRFDNVDMALKAAAQGLGVAMGRLPLVSADLTTGRLVSVLGPPRPVRTGYWLTARPETLARPEVAAFHDWIAAELKGPTPPGVDQRPL